jgi:hypothetical protein
MADHPPVTYFDRITEVKLGDVVDRKGIFSKRRGKITYIPGVSPKHREMEYGELRFVGIKIENGFIATLVDPEHGHLKKSIVFIARDAVSDPVKQGDVLFPDDVGIDDFADEKP